MAEALCAGEGGPEHGTDHGVTGAGRRSGVVGQVPRDSATEASEISCGNPGFEVTIFYIDLSVNSNVENE